MSVPIRTGDVVHSKERVMARLVIHLLGPFEVSLDTEPVAGFYSDKVRALLAYLCLEAGRPHRRERLAGLLWPDLPEPSARTNLRHALANLRRVLPVPCQSETGAGTGPFLQITRQTVQGNRESGAWVDALCFLALLEVPQHRLTHLEEAVALYRGELLEGFSLADSPIFEEWLLLQRERFGRLALDALNRLAEGYMLRGEYEPALAYAWRQVELDSLRETGHRLLMRLLAYSGRADEALVQYEACRRVLWEELGAEPSAETAQLHEQIRDGALPIAPPSPACLPAFLTAEESVEAVPPVFVARDHELARLGELLERARAGRGGVVLLVGEAGSGKTALLQEFGRRAREAHPGLLVTSGKGNTYTGVGDPYLPFRQALGLLTGDVESPWLAGVIDTSQALHLWDTLPAAFQALVEVGPDLVGTFLAGSPLLDRARAFLRWSGGVPADWVSSLAALVARQVPLASLPGPQQSDLFDQVTQVFHRLALPEALLLMLDDFQWADAGSIGLLFHLGRRLAGSRILAVVAYRPEEVGLTDRGERHPLLAVIHQMRREYGDVEIDLNQAGGREFLEAFLDSEPNCLGAAFRDRLYAQTAGHPLFTIEQLRVMQERGDLAKDAAGRWVEGAALDWKALPARTEAVIVERIGRLEASLQETLHIASVLGEEFTAEAVAHVQMVDKEVLLHRLSRELDRQHRLVTARGVQRIDSQHLSVYRFRHILFQNYLYNELDEVEQAHLHREVGKALEVLYEGHPEALAEITPHLARHFQMAGLPGKAIGYLHQAAERAIRMGANVAAVRHLTAGLGLLQTQPQTLERNQRELSMQLALGTLLQATEGYAAPETGRAAARARELVLCTDAVDPLQQVLACGLLGVYYATRAEYQTSLELYEQALSTARRLGHAALVAADHVGLGFLLIFTGDLAGALTNLQKAIDFCSSQCQQSLTQIIGQDVCATAHAWASWAQWLLGYPEQALTHSQEALSAAEASEHPYSLCFAHCIAGLRFHVLCRDLARARRYLEAIESRAMAERFPLLQIEVMMTGGWLLAEQGQAGAGIARLREGLVAREQMGTGAHKAYHLGLLAEACGRAGKVDAGLQWIAEALSVAERTGEHFYEAELHRLRGDLLAQSGTGNEAQATACYQRAVEVARSQSAKLLELRAATSLARMWHKQGRADEARQMLSNIYGWFSEGFDTPDLKETRALLEELS
jgi:DNA-binding SARP family transcriptional activator/predicted ATPase